MWTEILYVFSQETGLSAECTWFSAEYTRFSAECTGFSAEFTGFSAKSTEPIFENEWPRKRISKSSPGLVAEPTVTTKHKSVQSSFSSFGTAATKSTQHEMGTVRHKPKPRNFDIPIRADKVRNANKNRRGYGFRKKIKITNFSHF